MTLNVTAGTVYQIAIDGKAGATGQTNLRIGSVPANDTFAKAQTVTGQSFVVNATNVNATSEAGEPKPITGAAGNTVWFKWVAPTSGRYLLSAFATQIDTTAAVFTGSAVKRAYDRRLQRRHLDARYRRARAVQRHCGADLLFRRR